MNLIIVAREKLQPIYLQVFPMTNFEKPSIFAPKKSSARKQNN